MSQRRGHLRKQNLRRKYELAFVNCEFTGIRVMWRYAQAAPNVTAADELPPISAQVAAYGTPSLTRRERGSKMPDQTAGSGKSNQRKPARSSDQHNALHLCYGQIGISAVAAAARYQSGAKNPVVHAPVPVRTPEADAAVG
jgi:hypothetical protein